MTNRQLYNAVHRIALALMDEGFPKEPAMTVAIGVVFATNRKEVTTKVPLHIISKVLLEAFNSDILFVDCVMPKEYSESCYIGELVKFNGIEGTYEVMPVEDDGQCKKCSFVDTDDCFGCGIFDNYHYYFKRVII